MPPLPTAAHALRADHSFNAGADTNVLVRLHLGYTGDPPSSADALTLATGILGAYAAALRPLCSPNNELKSVTVTDLSTNTPGEATYPSATPGTRALHPNVPAGSALLLNHKIARKYRGGKPRSYWPFFDANDLVGAGEWSSAAVEAAQIAFNSWVTALTGLTAGTTVISGLCNVSYFSGYSAATIEPSGRAKNHTKLRVGGPVVDAVTSVVVSSRVGSQRRRNV
jgi:hypothetical protein